MKILLASSSFAGGGITSYAHELINCYSDGNEFSVIIGNDDQNPIVTEGVKVYKYDCSDISYDNVKRIIRLINTEIIPDVIISSCSKALALALPYLNDNIKVVTVSHSLKYIEADIAAYNNQFADTVIALSRFNKAYIDKAFNINDNNKVRVVYNFVREHPKAGHILELKKKRKQVIIVFTGGAAASKTPEIVINVANRLADTDLDFKLYWLGNTSIHLIRLFPFFRKKDIRDLVKKDSRIEFMGKIPRYEAEELIANADVFLSPSRREGCPMSLIEAMRIGVIPIVSDFNNANKEIVKDGENGFVVNRNDINRFVSIIKEIVQHKDSFYSIYDKSVETYYHELCYKVWRRKMDKSIFRDSLSHEKRFETMNSRDYHKSLRRFKLMQKKDNLVFLFQEPLRLLFRLQCFKGYNIT